MNPQTNPRPPAPLPVTITPGMSVVSLDGNPTSRILGITQAHCVYSLINHISVEPWRNLALAGVCPAEPLLPRSVEENDRLNASACVLQELSRLQSLGELTPAQATAMDELLRILCPSSRPNST